MAADAGALDTWTGWPCTDWVARFGLDLPDHALPTLAALTPQLSEPSRTFWQANAALAAGGLVMCGRWESFLRRFRAGRQVLSLRTKDNSVLYSRGPGIDIATQEPQPVQLDGDEFGSAIRLRCRIVEGGVIAMVPQGHDTRSL